MRWMLLLLLLCISLLRLRGAKALLFMRSFRLLIWLFIPILLFQSFFSYGTYIQHPFFMPLSIEGLQHAFFLCLHLLLIFFAALACLRLLSYYEWLTCIYHLPWLATLSMPYILLISSLRVHHATMLQEQKQIFKNSDAKWRMFPDLCVTSIETMFIVGRKEANDLWENWELRNHALSSQVVPITFAFADYIYMTLLIFGWSLFWIS